MTDKDLQREPHNHKLVLLCVGLCIIVVDGQNFGRKRMMMKQEVHSGTKYIIVIVASKPPASVKFNMDGTRANPT